MAATDFDVCVQTGWSRYTSIMTTDIDRTAELVLNANSEARQTLEVISHRWVSIILCALGDGPKRYSELDGMIEGLSQRMLTRTLKELERNGIVERIVHSTRPPNVEYTCGCARCGFHGWGHRTYAPEYPDCSDPGAAAAR